MRFTFLRSLLLGLAWAAVVVAVRVGPLFRAAWRESVERGGGDKVFVLFPPIPAWLLFGPLMLLISVWAARYLLGVRRGRSGQRIT